VRDTSTSADIEEVIGTEYGLADKMLHFLSDGAGPDLASNGKSEKGRGRGHVQH
jgi:hypothetical protein